MVAAGLMLGLLWGCDGSGNRLAEHATGSLEALELPDPAEPAPGIGFLTPDGSQTSLADFRGRVVLLNVWAMWCPPCRAELPTIAALDGADALIIVTEWKEFRSPDFDQMKQRLKSAVVFDGRNLYDPAWMRAAGFDYFPIGRA